MHRRAVFDPRSKRWEASIYMLGDRPSDGKLVPILTPIKTVATTVSTEGQASYHSLRDTTCELCALQFWGIGWRRLRRVATLFASRLHHEGR